MGKITTDNVDYSSDTTQMTGYLARPEGDADKYPGVLVVHEWWGLNDYVRGRARMLAELGYAALAVDMYGGGRTAQDPQGAGELMNSVLSNMDEGTRRFKSAYRLLAAQDCVDATRMAAIGYCFGGAVVLHGARIGMDLKAVVSFHGSLGSMHKPEPGGIKANILVCHGAADSLVPDADVDAFKAEMAAAHAACDFKAYPGALHGFSNPEASANGKKYGLPLAYDEAVDRQSWDDMNALFARVL